MRYIWSSDWSSPRAVANKRLLKQLMETGATQCVLVSNAPNSESKWRKELAELFRYVCDSMESNTEDVLLVLFRPSKGKLRDARRAVDNCAVNTLLLSR